MFAARAESDISSVECEMKKKFVEISQSRERERESRVLPLCRLCDLIFRDQTLSLSIYPFPAQNFIPREAPDRTARPTVTLQ